MLQITGRHRRRRKGGASAAKLGALAAVAIGAAVPPAAAGQDQPSPDGDRYSLAGGCYVMRSGATGRLVARSEDGYRASARGPSAAERFRMQATGLGEYLFYGERRDFLAVAAADHVEPEPEPSRSADWRLGEAASGGFTISSLADGKRLAVSQEGGELGVTSDQRAGDRELFSFEPARGCPRYPEIGTQATGPPLTGATPYTQVRGLLDAHLHLGAFEFLGGSAHCGRPWHRYGVAHALVDCPDHEPNGSTAVLENALSGNPAQTHDTTGWPTFADWPDHDSLTHEQTYYKWIERAWRGGLRLVVNDLVENRVLCEIYPFKQNPCDEMVSARLQIRRLYQLQGYIDAQEGGPGEGWFRIVRTPFAARRVINEGKLAVVLGIETSELFGCSVYNGVPQCDRAQIRHGLDRFHELGVRSLFPIHKFDNALGGVRFDSGETGVAVNAGNFYGTGRFWDAETCTGPAHDNPQTTAVPGDAGVIAAGLQAFLPGGLVPVYPPPPHCNTKGLSGLGQYLIRLAMRRGLIIEPDHMSVRASRRTLELLEANDYSGVIASHSWSDPLAFPRIYQLGGIVTPITTSSPEFVAEWRDLRRVRSGRFHFGIGFGADSNGLHVQPPPREGTAGNPVRYPFQSFDGSVTLGQQQSGRRVYDVNVDGVDHYGLHPDWIEDLRLVAGEGIVRDLAQGAEAYLQMWERTVGVPAERCRPARAGFAPGGLGPLRLGVAAEEVLRRGGQPSRRVGRSFRYCVGGRGASRVGVAFDRGGELGLVASTAPGHRARGVGPGDSARGLAGSRALGGGIRVVRTRRGTSFAYRVGGGRVRSVAVAAGPVTRSAERVRRYLRLALARQDLRRSA